MSTSAPAYGPPPPAPRRRRRGGVVGPLLLIFLGGVFLLQNTGYLPPNFWLNLWRLWPLVLVLAGIELLLAHRIPWLALAGLAAVVMIVGAVATGASLPQARSAAATVNRSVQTPLSGATQASIVVRFGVGALDVGPLPATTQDVLASMSFDGPSDVVVEPRYTPTSNGGAQLEYQLGGRGPGFMPFIGGRSAQPRMILELNPNVPISSMTIQTGATDARVDLGSLAVRSLDMSVGAASAMVRLPRVEGTSLVHVSGGASTITLEVPPGVAASIRHHGGLSTVTVDTNRFPQVADGLYRSVDYAAAASKVDMTLETGVTTIQVR